MQIPETGFGTLPDRFWLGLAITLAAAAYWPSLHAWFFLDDFRILLENARLQNAFDPAAVWQFSPQRFFASWTLAANYTLHGEQVFGYHLVNLAIHFGAGVTLYALLSALLRTPSLQSAPAWMPWVPILAAALYLLHPLQTQAVTYIVQRYTSLMALFYLLTLTAYVHARLRGSFWLAAAAALAGALAMLSKQTAATLPLAIVLLELLAFRQLSKRAWLAVLATGAGVALGTAWLLMQPAFDITGLTRETDQISRIDYLATQMEVLWRYLGLLFLIGEQRLEYDLAIASGFSSPRTWLMAAGHLAIIALGATCWRRQPLITFGVLFYYLAHAVESSFLPIIDVAFEHRAYLPNAGMLTVAAVALSWLAHALHRRGNVGVYFIVALLLVLALLTYQRNRLWSDQIEFLQHETRISPESQRAWTSLGKELMRSERFEDALKALQRAQAIALTRDDGRLRPPTLLNMIFALHYTGDHRSAVQFANGIDTRSFNNTETAFFHEARGRALLGMGHAAAARDDLQQAARINPTIPVVTFLAAAELELGNRQRASALARQVLELDPGNRIAGEVLRRSR